ncbi:unnamed protein product [Amoebophrya sp. A120]|nr:unnamed protein product [Amoebophrya sp. A120]|eukprot:GSA120T00003979001.1
MRGEAGWTASEEQKEWTMKSWTKCFHLRRLQRLSKLPNRATRAHLALTVNKYRLAPADEECDIMSRALCCLQEKYQSECFYAPYLIADAEDLIFIPDDHPRASDVTTPDASAPGETSSTSAGSSDSEASSVASSSRTQTPTDDGEATPTVLSSDGATDCSHHHRKKDEVPAQNHAASSSGETSAGTSDGDEQTSCQAQARTGSDRKLKEQCDMTSSGKSGDDIDENKRIVTVVINTNYIRPGTADDEGARGFALWEVLDKEASNKLFAIRRTKYAAELQQFISVSHSASSSRRP